MARNPNPLLQELLGARRADNSSTISRAAWASVLRLLKEYRAAEEIEAADPVANKILNPHAVIAKADQVIGATTDHGGLVQSAVGNFFSTLAPLSAGAKLIAAGLNVPYTNATISFPRSTSTPDAAGWVGEGEPIPVFENTLAADYLGPAKKFASMTVVSRELAKRSGGFVVFQQMLREKAAVSLDAALFSADAGDAAKVAGLRYGLSPIAGLGDVATDVAELLRGLGSLGGSGQSAIICSASEAAAIAVHLPWLQVPVWSTLALPTGTRMAIDPTAFAVSFGGVDIEASESGLVHMSDTPLEIVSGTGPATADPVRSLWQTATIGVRMVADIAFVARGGLCAVSEGAPWI